MATPAEVVQHYRHQPPPGTWSETRRIIEQLRSDLAATLAATLQREAAEELGEDVAELLIWKAIERNAVR